MGKDIYIEIKDRNTFLEYLKENPGVMLFKFKANSILATNTPIAGPI